MTLLVNAKTLGKAVAHAMFEARKDQGDASDGDTPLVLEMQRCA